MAEIVGFIITWFVPAIVIAALVFCFMKQLWWALGIAILTSVLTLVAFIRAGYHVFWSDAEPQVGESEVREAPLAMLVPMGVLAGLCVLIGLYPQVVYPLLHRAALALASIQ